MDYTTVAASIKHILLVCLILAAIAPSVVTTFSYVMTTENTMSKKNANAVAVAPAPKPAGKAATKALMALIAQAVTAVRTTVQSITAMEPIVATAAIAALKHAEKTGDAMPMDRLVKDIQAVAHPMTKAMLLELVSWTKANSPIFWDAKQAIHLKKPGQDGYKPFDITSAETKAFFQTDQAVKARKAGADAHAQNMKPFAFKDFFGRVMGLQKTYEAALVADKDGNIRGVVKDDMKKIEALIASVKKAAVTAV